MRALIVLLLALAAPAAWAATSAPGAARLAELAAKPRWHALLHINPGATLRGIGKSYVDDPDFFLARDGARDPVAELRATWAALKTPGSRARCRYPARYKFLAENLGWHEAKPLARCTQYLKWRAQMPLGRLVLVYPAAYLNSPSSMFGHTLLRLDTKPHPDSVWLSRAISFGAQTTGHDNSAAYIWRGLAGGYHGLFSVESYVKKIREYGFLENRDIWEYALNLDHDELDWLVAHLWELRGVNFDYYFFDENCSFRLLELLKVARPNAPLLDHLRFAELPANTVRELYAAGMVTGRRYRPSKVHVLDHLAAGLKPDELALAQKLVDHPDMATTRRFTRYPRKRRHLIAQVAYQALRVRHRDAPRSEAVARDSLALLRVVQRNPGPDIPPLSPPPAPETGHKTQMFALAAGALDGTGYAELGYRLTYHGVLDPLAGYPPGAGIKGLNLRLRAYDNGDFELEKLGLVNIRSIAPRGPFFKPISWFVHAGFEQAPVRRGRHLGLFLQGGPGASWRLGSLMPYAFAIARIESVRHEHTAVALGAGAEIGALYVTPRVQLGARAKLVYYAQHFYRRRVSVTADVPVSTNNAIRGECGYDSWRTHGHTDCRLELRHFFN